nr:alpha/beta fold hydrolase [Actinomycetales bacterium]
MSTTTDSATHSSDSAIPGPATRTATALRWLPPAAIIAALAAGLALTQPLGPISTAQAFAAMALSLTAGFFSVLLAPSRWLLLVGPLLFISTTELTRIGSTSPTTGVPELGSSLGVVAFAVGRVIPYALLIGPMLLGIALGFETAGHLARRRRPGIPTPRPLRAPGWLATALLAGLLAWLVIAMARPASTPPILGADGEPLPNSIAELTAVELGGHEQALMIRGRSADNPVLLYLHGGPGGTDIGAMRRDTGLEESFVVVTWDQRGSGRSTAALEPRETLTVEQLVADTIELAEYLCERFGEERIYLVGQSWGSLLAVLTAEERPDLFAAVVGVGQIVSIPETDRAFWEDSLAWAEDSGNVALAEQLRANGPPPYEDVGLYAHAASTEHQWNPYPEFNPNNEMPAILFVPEYTFMDRVNAFRGFLEAAAVLYPQAQSVDLRVDAPGLELPYVMVLGEYEARGRVEPAQEWFGSLAAPLKLKFEFDAAGHRANFDQPADFAAVMQELI